MFRWGRVDHQYSRVARRCSWRDPPPRAFESLSRVDQTGNSSQFRNRSKSIECDGWVNGIGEWTLKTPFIICQRRRHALRNARAFASRASWRSQMEPLSALALRGWHDRNKGQRADGIGQCERVRSAAAAHTFVFASDADTPIMPAKNAIACRVALTSFLRSAGTPPSQVGLVGDLDWLSRVGVCGSASSSGMPPGACVTARSRSGLPQSSLAADRAQSQNLYLLKVSMRSSKTHRTRRPTPRSRRSASARLARPSLRLLYSRTR